jgi:acyl phosphate:glycerol-3-phosphate acyltransferase
VSIGATIVIGYLLGSFPTGLLIGRVAGIGDVRGYGSGKTGFTNSLRTMGIRWAILVLLIDAAKGAAPVLIGKLIFDEPWAAALGGVAAVIGHTWPVFAGFRGGRGVATALGAFIAVSPLAALAVLVIGLVVLAIFRYVSAMSIVGTFAGFIAIVVLVVADRAAQPYLLFGLITMLAIELNHLGNIKRLLAGTEPKIGKGGQRRDTAGA